MESDAAAAGDDELQGNGYLAYANGVRGFVRSMPSGAAFTSFDIIGDEARAYTGDDGMSWRLVRRVEGDIERPSMRPLSNRFKGTLPVEYPFPLPNRLQASGLAIVEDLVGCIASGESPQCSGEDGRAALEVAIAMRESHRRDGQRVQLPLADRELRLVSSDTFQDHTPARLRRKK
jgi:predicted dehydrogenase